MINFKTNILNLTRNIKEIFISDERDKNSKLEKSFIQKIRIWVMLSLGITLFIILINQISFSDFIKIFSKVNILYFIAAFLVGISVTIIKTIRFGLFFPAPGRWFSLYGVFAFLRVLYYVLPFNTGEIVYLTTLKKYRFTPSIMEIAPTWFFLRLTDIIALSLWFIIILFLVPFTGNLFGEMYAFRWIIIATALALVLIILTLPVWIPRIKLGDKINWFTSRVKKLKSGFSRTFGITTLLRTVIISLLIWFAAILFDTLALVAFNTPLSFMECFLASTAIYCISLLPINAPLNLGTDEALWTGVLMLAGVTSIQAISIALSLRVVNFLVLLTEGLTGFSILILRENNRTSTNFLQENMNS